MNNIGSRYNLIKDNISIIDYNENKSELNGYNGLSIDRVNNMSIVSRKHQDSKISTEDSLNQQENFGEGGSVGCANTAQVELVNHFLRNTLCTVLKKNFQEIFEQVIGKIRTPRVKKRVSNPIVNTCGHDELGHYAKGMCKTCYHKTERAKKSYLCRHSDKALYAKGKCKKCYQEEYFINVKNVVKYLEKKEKE
jgi:hypothetical protein